MQRRHRERLEALAQPPNPRGTPELAAAWRALQLHWLRTIPGYRAIVRERIDEAARGREKRTRRLDVLRGIEEARPKYERIEGAQKPPIDPALVKLGLRELLDGIED